ncbi:hypothetical protein AB1Y20_001464 [Prymnesium parvum]|uniref:SET domain-containing protein n=1 Tax=Prymnesium parvum TaxID=97485 RepID=A0AB34KBR6_PRYPA
MSPVTSLTLAQSWALQAGVALTLVGSARVYAQRPRGWLAAPHALEVSRSQVPGGGRGVFAAETLPPGTVLGTYPGRLVPLGPYTRKLKIAPRTSNYCWTLGGDRGALDPTDEQGILCEPLPFFKDLPSLDMLSIDTTLALINEPSPGFDVNVKSEEVGEDVYFYTERQLLAGEELFLDYGTTYDRSSYTRS